MTIAEFAVPPVVKEVSVRVAPARAFELFARDLTRWWPIAQFHTGPDPVDCAIEPRVGGRVFERSADGKETSWGTVVAYEPPQRLAFSWLIGGLSTEQAQLIDIRFTPEPTGTRVELTHSGWEKLGDAVAAAALRERYNRGWATLIERCYADYANTATRTEEKSTMPMIVHGIPGSPYVRAALLALEEKGLEYELAAMRFGTLKQEPHLSRQPFGRIPAFEHDGWQLYETQAIMRYADAIGGGARLQPDEPRAAARMNQLMGITDWYVMPQVSAAITFGRVVAPRVNLPVDEARIAQSLPNARACIAEIGRLLGGQTWLAGETLSLADLLLAPHLSMFAEAPEGGAILADHPNLAGWLARMEARPSMRATTWDRLLDRAKAAA